MAVAHRIDETAYEQFVLSGAEGAWELHDGRLVEKPGMTWEHGDIIVRHVAFLYQQLNEGEYRVRANEGRLRRSIDTVFIPDLLVVPTEYGREWRGRPGTLAIFSPPVPLVVDGRSRPAATTSMRRFRCTDSAAIWRSGASTRSSGR